MPIYEYRCDNGHTLEVMHRMSDDPLASCTTCAAPVQRVFHPVAVHFKGSGFYSTDYGKNKQPEGGEDGKVKTGSEDSSKASSDDSKASSKSDTSDSKPKAGSSDSKSSKSSA